MEKDVQGRGGFDAWKLWFYFFVFAGVGWVMEVLVTMYISGGYFVNAGFLRGPWLPIYGVGAVLTAVIAKRVADTKWLFLVGFTLCGLGEYLTSLVLDLVYHAKWWDYSGWWLNIDGRTCVPVMIVFAMLVLAVAKVALPHLERLYKRFNQKIFRAIMVALIVAFFTDVAYSLWRPNLTEGMPERPGIVTAEEV